MRRLKKLWNTYFGKKKTSPSTYANSNTLKLLTRHATSYIIIHLVFRIPSGKVSVLVVGGALEALEGHQNEIRLIINRRKGFIKLALRYGVDLVPTFSFGEQAIYTQAENEKGNM